ncbi:DUF58 domain-containing protein [Aquifex pyrophilus]
MKVKVNKTGKLFIAITIIMGVAAVNTGNNLLYLIVSYMLSGMLVAGLISIYNLRGLKITVKLPDEVYAGIPTVGSIGVKKEGIFPSFLIKVRNGFSEVLFTIVEKDFKFKETEFLFPKRGYYDKLKLEVSSDFPLGMFTRSYETEIDINLVVFPKPLKTNVKDVILKDARGRESLEEKGQGGEDIKEIKDYINEPVKLIHWKISAKYDELKVKVTEGEEQKSVILSLDSVKGSKEEKLSRLAYLINEYMSKGYAVGLELGKKRIEPSTGRKHKLKLLKELALY